MAAAIHAPSAATPRAGAGACIAAPPHFRPGAKVEYYSQNNGGWMPAVVLDFDQAASTYKLDIHPAAQPGKIRLAASSAAPPDVPDIFTFPHVEGAAVEYYSASQQRWVPAVVRSFNMGTGRYVLDIHPDAPADRVRASAGAGYTASAPPNALAQPPALPQGSPARGQQQPHQQGPGPPVLPQPPQQQQTPGPHPTGSSVEYYSTSQGGWVPAKVCGYDARTGNYVLDIHPAAPASKVRPVMGSGAPAACQQNSAVPPPQPAQQPAQPAQPGAASDAPGQAGVRTCGLCHAAFPADSLLGAECEHRFCVTCLRGYVGGLDFIREHVSCPSCSVVVKAAQVQKLMGNEVYKARQAEVARQDAELASRLAQGGAITCSRCGKEHDGISCEQYHDWEKKNRDADRTFEEFVGKMQLRCCPVCGAPSERGEGCNFMQCRSDKCRKYTYWCYICGHQMRLEDHYSHYPHGPWVDECCTPVNQRLPMPVPGQIAAAAPPALGPSTFLPQPGNAPAMHGPGMHAAAPARGASAGAEADDGNCVCQ